MQLFVYKLHPRCLSNLKSINSALILTFSFLASHNHHQPWRCSCDCVVLRSNPLHRLTFILPLQPFIIICLFTVAGDNSIRPYFVIGPYALAILFRIPYPFTFGQLRLANYMAHIFGYIYGLLLPMFGQSWLICHRACYRVLHTHKPTHTHTHAYTSTQENILCSHY